MKSSDIPVILGFVALGLIISQFGPLYSAASVQMGFDSARIGWLTSVLFGCSLIGLFIGIVVADAWGKIRFLQTGSIILIAGYALGWMAGSFVTLLIASTVIGCGIGFYQTGVNSLAVDTVAQLSASRQARRMSFLQCFFGLGAILGPNLVTLAQVGLGDWRWSFPLIACLGPVLCLIVFTRFAGNPLFQKAPNIHPFRSNLVVTPLLALFLVISFLYAAFETSTFSWLPYYWDTQIGRTGWMGGAQMISLFWLVFSASRLLTGYLVEWLGAYRWILWSGLGITLLQLIWAFQSGSAFAVGTIVVLSGVLSGCMIPSLLVVTNRLFPGRSAYVSGQFFIYVTISATLSPMLIGQVSESAGIGILPWVLGIFSLLFTAGTAFTFYLYHARASVD